MHNISDSEFEFRQKGPTTTELSAIVRLKYHTLIMGMKVCPLFLDCLGCNPFYT